MPITDKESAEEWAKAVSQEARVAFAARCALRALPGLGMVPYALIPRLALPILRAALTSGVAAVRPASEVIEAASSASGRSDYTESSFSFSPEHAADTSASPLYSAARSADCAVRSTTLEAARSAFSAADSLGSAAIGSPFSAAFGAADVDANRLSTDTPEFLFRHPLWSGASMPEGLLEAYEKLKEFWETDMATWGFWKRWYDGILNGRPISWELQKKVAVIPNGEWEKGPERIAELVREIEQERRQDQEPDSDAIEAERQRSGEALKRHVRRLLEQSAASEINAVGLAWQIRTEIDRYCNTHCTDINETPEELKPFEAIADVLARIGSTFAKAGIEGQEKDRVASDLESQIAELQLRIKTLEIELADAKTKEVKGLVAQGFYRSIGPSLWFACTTTVVGAANYFIAPEFAPEIVRHLGDRFTSLFSKPPQYFPQIGSD